MSDVPLEIGSPRPARRQAARDGRGYRRKWKRVPPERRRAAVESLADLFAHRKVRRALWGVLAVSLTCHAGLLPFLTVDKRGTLNELAVQENTYLRKVMQKERAKKISREIEHRVTMPPPPPDPEAVVESALSESLAEDVGKVTDGLMSVDLQAELASHIKSTLKDELAAAARNIAEGALTEDEIRALHLRFQKKAHDTAKTWRDDYLIKHQEERAAMNTTQWYENDVSKTLFGNLWYQVLGPGNRWPPSAQIWRRAYTGVYGWGRYHNWSRLIADGWLRRKIGHLQGLLRPAGRRGKDTPPWPAPDAAHAEKVVGMLRYVFRGRYTQTYPKPSWKDVIYGSEGPPRMTYGLLEDMFPHRREEMAEKYAKPLDALWTAALAAGDEYLEKAQTNAPAAELAKAQADCRDAIGKIIAATSPLLVGNPKQYDTINWAIRLDITTGPERDRMYDLWVNEIVNGLFPLIRDFARSQFNKGIIVHKDGVEQAMKEFPAKIKPLLIRDVKKMLTRRKFHDRVLDTVYGKGYSSKVTERGRLPTRADAKAEMAAAKKILAGWPQRDRAYAPARRKLLTRYFGDAVTRTKEAALEMVFTGNLLYRKMGSFVEGVDYADKVQEKLDARAMALAGRGQDLAKLTTEGVPDTSAPLVALMFGASRGHGANLEPVQTSMYPRYPAPGSAILQALRTLPPAWPRAPAKWGFEEQATVKPKFTAWRYEAVPFLAKFPRLDGDLRDWGRVRPLFLRPPRGDSEPIVLYAAWNYQGFFFGYRVRRHPDEFYWPSLYRVSYSLHSYVLGAGMAKNTGVGWAFAGDYLRLMFDTLDARSPTRGEPHTQEFVIFPQGTENSPEMPGIERVIRSKRDAKTKSYRGVKDACKIFPQQPPRSHGPDGTGPYRVARVTESGYSVEVFLPRSAFNHPVFCPGWHIGFEAAVATGHQGRQFRGQAWAHRDRNFADHPNAWGDLLLLGTDARVIVQEATRAGDVSHCIVPGYSYLVTVIDPDRNVRPTAIDTVLVSAEVDRGLGESDAGGDVEVFVLNEVKPNAGMFRGYVNTQPGTGRKVQGVLEVMPLQEVRFGYVDVANAKGDRNVIQRLRLPVVSGVLGAVSVQP